MQEHWGSTEMVSEYNLLLYSSLTLHSRAGTNCPRRRGPTYRDARCQCAGYCGYRCRGRCIRDSECFWRKGKCYNRETRQVGRSMHTCLASSSPTQLPTSSPQPQTCMPTRAPSPPTTFSPTSSPVPVQYSYIGCYADEYQPNRKLPVLLATRDIDPTYRNTVRRCAFLAREAGLPYFGVQDSAECWGGADLKLARSHGPGVCDYHCDGYWPEICGGDWSFSLYRITR